VDNTEIIQTKGDTMQTVTSQPKRNSADEIHELNVQLDRFFNKDNKLENVNVDEMKAALDKAINFSAGAMIAEQVTERIGEDLAARIAANITFDYRKPQHWGREIGRGVAVVVGAALAGTAINYSVRAVKKYRGQPTAPGTNPFADTTGVRGGKHVRRSETSTEANLHSLVIHPALVYPASAFTPIAPSGDGFF
jgi:hypothetical protein